MINTNWTSLDKKTFILNLNSKFESQSLYLKKIKIGNEDQIDFSIIMLHDYCFHHGEFENVINYLNDIGINANVYLLDLVGHGQSSGTRCFVDAFQTYVDDVSFVYQQIKHEFSGKVILMGQGLGGSIWLDFYNRLSAEETKVINGIILSNFLFKINNMVGKVSLNKLMKVKIVGRMRFLKYSDPRDLTSDQGEILKRLKDPLFINNPPFYGVQLLNENSKRIYHDAYFIENSILVLWGEKSKLVSSALMGHFKKGIKKEFLTEKNYSHMKHDLYNESERNLVFNDIYNWMMKL